jgi:cyclopropane-fatty-acyl-phospholipid synthase
VTAPDELGFGRAYVAGELEVDGDMFDVMAVANYIEDLHLGPRQIAAAAKLVGWRGLKPLPPPPEEARLHGRRHSRERDAAAIAHHYDVSNDFYEMVLGPSLTYSCAVWHDDTATLEDAQADKYELICSKLALEPGMRLLDIGCGWGGMLLHAAEHHGVHAVGVTLSQPQADLARKRAAERGLGDRVEVRHADFRDVTDGPYDAISSIGMFEHVGLSELDRYFARCRSLLRPEGRLLNHGISRPHHAGKKDHHRWAPSRLGRSFTERYVFPDGELHEIGNVVSAIQRAGFEARHVESLREHYALTLRCWLRNLEEHWDDAVAEVGAGRARVWRLYMAAAAMGFEHDDNQIHQVLATATTAGRSGMPLRPEFT